MITAFQGEWRFLSNFWPAVVPLALDGKLYPTVEHAYQAAKSDDPVLRKMIRDATSPRTAKSLGRKAHLRDGWDTERLAVMEALLREKFKNGALMASLQKTYPHELVEGNTWGDRFWGQCEGQGENHLGRLLMALRDEGRVVTTVRNQNDGALQPGEVYIGRGGPWGNPFVVGKEHTRDEAVAKYRVYLWQRIEEQSVTIEQLARLHGKTLVCFCKPKACHGDVLVAAAAWAAEQIAQKA